MIIATKPCYDHIQNFLLACKIEDIRNLPNDNDLTSGQRSGLQDPPQLSVSNIRLHVPFLSQGNAISLSISQGSTCMISRPVGCGISTLLKVIIGENKPIVGTINLQTTHIGYCAQTPWLQNTSIKKKIIGTNVEDEEWYRKIIYTCNLDLDISQMPNGDDTQVGNRGLSISGGQKHRIVSHCSDIICLYWYQ